MTNLVLVLCGGAVGALARYLIDRTVARRMTAFPLGTLTVNAIGSLILGTLAGLATAHPGLPDWVRLLLAVGFCGALTTYSTFALETVRLVQSGARRYASINVGATLAVGLIAVSVGWLLGSA